jgi:Flp pilus assembly pilin Flp
MIGKSIKFWTNGAFAATEYGLLTAGIALVVTGTVVPNAVQPIILLFVIWLALNGLFFAWLLWQTGQENSVKKN